MTAFGIFLVRFERRQLGRERTGRFQTAEVLSGHCVDLETLALTSRLDVVPPQLKFEFRSRGRVCSWLQLGESVVRHFPNGWCAHLSFIQTSWSSRTVEDNRTTQQANRRANGVPTIWTHIFDCP